MIRYISLTSLCRSSKLVLAGCVYVAVLWARACAHRCCLLSWCRAAVVDNVSPCLSELVHKPPETPLGPAAKGARTPVALRCCAACGNGKARPCRWCGDSKLHRRSAQRASVCTKRSGVARWQRTGTSCTHKWSILEWPADSAAVELCTSRRELVVPRRHRDRLSRGLCRSR